MPRFATCIRFTKHNTTNGALQFLENIPEAFETNVQSKKEERLEREIQKLKTMVGELTMELKKTIGKDSPQAICGNRRIRPSDFANDPAAQSRASVLGLSAGLGIYEFYRACCHQQKARLSAASKKRFAC